MALIGIILFGIPSVIIAAKKGFAPFRWLIAFGLIGLITVSSLSSARADGIDEDERIRRAEKGNRVGAIMCGCCLGLSALLTLVMLSMR